MLIVYSASLGTAKFLPYADNCAGAWMGLDDPVRYRKVLVGRLGKVSFAFSLRMGLLYWY